MFDLAKMLEEVEKYVPVLNSLIEALTHHTAALNAHTDALNNASKPSTDS